ncbi:MAG: hypothetical protein ACOYN0_05820 [Phycisphaerales bacterium]
MNPHAPGQPSEGTPSAKRGMSAAKVAVQIVGAVASIALLAWCIRIALRDDNRAALERVLAGDPWLMLSMLALCALSLLANGTLFVLTISPVRRVHWLSCCATNAAATFLNNFPFKLSLATRFLVHMRRDGIPLLMVASWIGATAVVILAVLAAPLAATVWRGKVDGWWWGATGAGLVVGYVLIVGVAGLFAGERGRGRIESIAARLRIPLLPRLLRTNAYARMHTGLDMLAGRRAVGAGFAMRILDTAFIAGRFAVAAKLAGVVASPGSIVLAATTYFFIGAVTPSGALGARDGGTLGALKFLPIAGVIGDDFAVVILTVTASEFIVNLCAASASALYLRFSKARPAREVTVVIR